MYNNSLDIKTNKRDNFLTSVGAMSAFCSDWFHLPDDFHHLQDQVIL